MEGGGGVCKVVEVCARCISSERVKESRRQFAAAGCAGWRELPRRPGLGLEGGGASNVVEGCGGE